MNERIRSSLNAVNLLNLFSIVYTGLAIGVRGKERINRTRLTRTGADHCG
jgi:hypothetical protein